jgi:NAD(P)H-hydrate epimerase
MIKIFSAKQIQEADQFTIQNTPISSINLMECAAEACVNYLLNTIPSGISFALFCGSGNNGGDGFAIARLLYNRGKNVELFSIETGSKRSSDNQTNFDRLPSELKQRVTSITSANEFPKLTPDYIIIDALLGTGINRKSDGNLLLLIQHLNIQVCKRIAIDIPSGLYVDKQTEDLNAVVHCNQTLTFQFPKQSFFYPEYAAAVGGFEVLDIGIHIDFIKSEPTKFALVEEQDVKAMISSRAAFSHKGDFGHALLLAGSKGKAGAAILSAKACLRTGAGLVTVNTANACLSPLQTAAPEIMVEADEDENKIARFIKVERYDVVGIGPGVGLEAETAQVIKQMIQEFKAPMVFDADALNILADNKTWLSFLPNGSILTPHIGEFRRLAGNYSNPFDRTEAQIDLAKKLNCYIILKGKYTAIATPDGKVFFNPTGNPGMATAGSGDVLTGIICGLLAQGFVSGKATILGVYLHGLSGDFAEEVLTTYSLNAGDIIEFLPKAFEHILY